MTRHCPSIKSCINRLQHNVLGNYPVFLENGKELRESFLTKILPFFEKFVKDAIECCFVCGFVPYEIRTRNNVRVPFVLELGTFTWTTQVIKHATSSNHSAHLQYVVAARGANVDVSKIYIYEHSTPSITNYKKSLISPMHDLFKKYCQLQQIYTALMMAYEWNAQKHIAVTEKVDFKEQTISGIQLLDQCRRYSLSGNSGPKDSQYLRLRGRNNEDLTSVNDAHAYWVRDQFGHTKTDCTKLHILPPNTDLHELSTVSGLTADLKELQTQFDNDVHTFFDAPRSADVASSKNTASSESLTRNSFISVLFMCRFLGALCEQAYAKCYDAKRISIHLEPQARMEINDASELKVLFEHNVLGNFDRKKVRKMYGL